MAPSGATRCIMTTDDDATVWHALYQLETKYWHDVDFNSGRAAHEFYVAEGLFVVGDNCFRGRERIREFYAWRERRGTSTVRSVRTTRHLVSNLLVDRAAADEVRVTGVISFFDGVGRPPVMSTKPAILIADISNECVRGEDGRWRFKSHVLQPVFMGDEVPLSIAVDLSR
jgi:hypothetical protein